MLTTLKLPLYDALDTVYAGLPKLECKRLCQECCGPILMTGGEWDRIGERLGHYPRPTPEQAERLECPMLTAGGGCSVYDIRPAICRLWGMVPAMACPHGCEPERWLSDEEAKEFLDRIDRIGGST